MIDELSTLNESGGSEYSDDNDVGQRKRADEAIDGSSHNRRNLNEDSDLDIDEYDGTNVGDSGSEKGEPIEYKHDWTILSYYKFVTLII